MATKKNESVVADPKEVKKAMHKEAAEKINRVLSKQDQKKLEKALKQAKLPIEVYDDDFKMGEREIDIRKLSTQNKEQLKFRYVNLLSAYALNITQTLVDIQSILIGLLIKLGVTDVAQFLTDTMDEIHKQNSNKK